MKCFSRYIFAGALVFACAGASAKDTKGPVSTEKPANEGQTPIVEKIDIRPGDRWTYQIVDDITGQIKFNITYTITEIKNDTLSVSVALTPYGQSANRTIVQVYDKEWNLLEDPVWKRYPGDPASGVSLPLKVGLQWKIHFNAARKNPDVNNRGDAAARVVDYEQVILKFNRSYDTFKIEMVESISNGENPSVAKLHIASWYAPEVNRYVKKITETRVDGRLLSRMIEQMTDYGRRDD